MVLLLLRVVDIIRLTTTRVEVASLRILEAGRRPIHLLLLIRFCVECEVAVVYLLHLDKYLRVAGDVKLDGGEEGAEGAEPRFLLLGRSLILLG